MTSDMHALNATLASYGVSEPVATQFRAPGQARLAVQGRRDEQRLDGLSIVTLSYRRPDLFCRMADSLPAHAFPNSDKILERVCVNNGGDRATRDEAECRGWTVVEPGSNLSFAEGCNVGVRETHTGHVILLNNDVVLSPGALDIFWAHRDYPLVAPLILRSDGRVNFAGGILQMPDLWPIHLGRDVDVSTLSMENRVTPWATAACLMVARQLWDELGGMDERYIGYGGFQDADFALRAGERGAHPLIAMQAVVHHDEFGTRSGSEDGPNMRRFHAEWLATGRLRRLVGLA